jgi:DNA-binding CsgD family transcriptional regulator
MSDSPTPLAFRSQWKGAFELRNRRGPARRKDDHRQSVLAALSQWFANAEPLPLFVLDCTSSVVLMNVHARRILGATSSLALNGPRLQFASPAQQAALGQALSHTHDPSERPAPIQSLDITATVTYIAAGHEHLTALKILRLCGCDYRSHAVQSTFHLTAAETDIALRIYAGSSLVAIARERNASVNTVKTQVAHLFQKCGVRSLTTLVRRLSDIVPATFD